MPAHQQRPVRTINQPVTNALASRDRLLRNLPGIARLLDYRRGDFRHDLAGGMAVAAVAVPLGIASAQLAGLPPATGLYASILPLAAYALFGTSPQLVIGASAAGAALVASAIGPLAGGDATQYLALTTVLTLLVALMCVIASFLRLGAIADFLSRPILVGFMNGLALSILLGQMGPLFGISLASAGFFPRALEFLAALPRTHLPTLGVGLLSLAALLAAARFLPRVPAALVAMAVAALATRLLQLEQAGVAMIGTVAGGLPRLSVPSVPLHLLPVLLAEAAGLALVSFSSMMLVARSFADRNRYDVDPDREIAALGAANLAAALSQGFVVTASGTRTAVAESAGARTQVAGLVAAGLVAVVLLFLTWPLRFVPAVSLAAILVVTGLSLFDWKGLRAIHRIEPQEFWLANIASVGVLLFGAIEAILFVVVLALLRFVRLTARPGVEILGEVGDNGGYQSLERHPDAQPPDGLLLFRYHGPIVFFSAPHFRKAVRKVVAEAESGPGVRWFVIDLLPVSMIDTTGLFALRDAFDSLRARGIVVAAAGRDAEWADRAAHRDLSGVLAGIRFFPTLRQAEATYRAEAGGAAGVDAATQSRGHPAAPAGPGCAGPGGVG